MPTNKNYAPNTTSNVEALAQKALEYQVEIHAELKKLQRLEKLALEAKVNATKQRQENAKFISAVGELFEKLKTIDKLVVERYFPESKTAVNELEKLKATIDQINNNSLEAISNAEMLILKLQTQKQAADMLLEEVTNLGLAAILKNKLTRKTELQKIDTKLIQLCDDLLNLKKASRNTLDTSKKYLEQSNDCFKQVKTNIKICYEIEIVKAGNLRPLSDFADVFKQQQQRYLDFVALLQKLTNDYQEKAPKRNYKQATQRVNSLKILNDLIAEQDALITKGPQICFDRLLKTLNDQVRLTQADHRKGALSFFTSSSLVQTYQKILKAIPADEQVNSANRFKKYPTKLTYKY